MSIKITLSCEMEGCERSQTLDGQIQDGQLLPPVYSWPFHYWRNLDIRPEGVLLCPEHEREFAPKFLRGSLA